MEVQLSLNIKGRGEEIGLESSADTKICGCSSLLSKMIQYLYITYAYPPIEISHL
jgi:hypothetical protein